MRTARHAEYLAKLPLVMRAFGSLNLDAVPEL